MPPFHWYLPFAACFLPLVALGVGCAHSGAERDREISLLPPSRHTVGDFATYVYEGADLPLPVIVNYRVLEVRGARVRLSVTMTRDDETKTWLQDIVDTPENRKSSKVESVHSQSPTGEWSTLQQPDTDELETLFAWTIPRGQFVQTGNAFPFPQPIVVGEQKFLARCLDVDGHLALTPVSLSRCESEEFVWTHFSAAMSQQSDGEILWSVRLDGFGHEALPAPLPEEGRPASPLSAD